MKKSIIVFLIGILIFSVNLAGAVSTDTAAMKDSIEVNLTTSQKCLAGLS
jgi:hypothetical protein